jgi:hypothetical protein
MSETYLVYRPTPTAPELGAENWSRRRGLISSHLPNVLALAPLNAEALNS